MKRTRRSGGGDTAGLGRETRRAGRGARLFTSVLVTPLGVLASAGAARADTIAVGLRPEIGLQAGTETTELSATVSGATTGTTLSARSKLTYPADTTLVGGTVWGGTGALSFFGSALTNLSNPGGRMLDQDFVTATSGAVTQSVEFSHTESRTTLRAVIAEGGVRVRVAELAPEAEKATLRLVGGFRFESNTVDVYGAHGWQLDASSNQVTLDIADDVKGIHYESKYYLPFVGARIDAKFGAFDFGSEARFLAAWSTHDDDHVLRHKLAHAAPHGLGLALAAEPAIDLGGGPAAHVFLGLDAQLEYLAAIDGTLEQHYYADDPSIMGDQTGEPIPDASYTYTNFRARILATIEVRF